jgi:hypothetical protein
MPSDTDLAYLHAGAASVSRIGRRTKSAIWRSCGLAHNYWDYFK